ncbi:MAG TPA: ABC transporter substrate-binding protein [Anaeromyxobacter sp.]
MNRVASKLLALAALAALATPPATRAEQAEIRIAKQFGLGYLPLVVLEEQRLVEKRAAAAGLGDVKVSWVTLSGGPAASDALLSKSVDYVATGVAPLVLLWARTGGAVKGVSALDAVPIYVNTTNPAVKSIRDFGEKDRIAVPAVKVSIQAVVLQMAAAKAFGDQGYTRLDPLTVALKHPDAAVALLSGGGAISAHAASPPYVAQELADHRVRTVLNSFELLGGPHTFNVLSSTQAFADANPRTFAVVYAALAEAVEWIRANRRAAAELYVRASRSKEPVEAILAQLDDPAVSFTTTPQRIGAFTDFLAKIGTIPARPASWKDLFFKTVHTQPGS